MMIVIKSRRLPCLHSAVDKPSPNGELAINRDGAVQLHAMQPYTGYPAIKQQPDEEQLHISNDDRSFL